MADTDLDSALNTYVEDTLAEMLTMQLSFPTKNPLRIEKEDLVDPDDDDEFMPNPIPGGS